MAKGSLREQMPVVAAWIDDLRAAFGAEHIDAIIRDGMRGKPVFYASENGHTIGTPMPAPAGPVAESPLSAREDRLNKQYQACRHSAGAPAPNKK